MYADGHYRAYEGCARAGEVRFSRLPTFFTLSLYCTLLALQVSGGGAVERHGRRSACLHAFVHCRGLKDVHSTAVLLRVGEC